MSKNTLIILIVVIVVLVAVGIWVGMHLSSNKTGAASPYSAVYLSTGDIYFGKFSHFPSPHMTNVWYIQRGVDAKNQPQVGIAPFKSVFWGPIDEVNFNEKQIVLVTKLAADSQVVKAIESGGTGMQSPTGAPAPTGPATSSAPAATTTP
jgi:hypothetical protein